MSRRLLLTGPDYSTLESRAFDLLADTVGTQPESILYIAQQEHPEDATRERWRDFGPSAALRLDSVVSFITHCYKRDQFKGRATHINLQLLTRLTELAVEDISSPTNPLCTHQRFPSPDLVREARALFTALEFAGLLSSEAMQSRLEEEGIADHAAHVGELADAIETVRTEVLTDDIAETYSSERLHHIASTSTPLTNLLPSVDAVVIGGFTRFDVIEFDLLKRVTETWPTIALLPQQTNDLSSPGIDSGAAQALESYIELDFSHEFCDEPQSEGTEFRRRLARNLYRHPEQSPNLNNIDPAALDLSVLEPETISDELRHMAKDIRSKIAAGAQLDDIGVVLLDPVQYADRVRETFEAYKLPFSLQTEIPLVETAVGGVVQAVCQLAREPRTVDSLLQLLTSPLVTVDHGTDRLDHRKLVRVAARAETNRLDSMLEYLDNELAATIESLLQDASTLSDVPLSSLSDEMNTLLERLGVIAVLKDEQSASLSPALQTREQSAHESLTGVFETLTLTEALADLNIGDSVDRLERALHSVSIQHASRPTQENIVVCSLTESLPRDLEHVFILGLTSTHFPSNPNRMAFVDPIYEGHPDFEQTDVLAEARYRFGALLSSEASVHLSAPQRTISGEPYVEADILTELRRLVDFSSIIAEADGGEPGCQEDVQRSIGGVVGKRHPDRANELADQAVEAETFDITQRSRVEAGMTCATARRHPEVTHYDGRLTTETVTRIRSATDRESYSTSQLESYALCGFKYYMQYLFETRASDPLTREPDARARGSYVHDVLERYYLSLQSRDGEPVAPDGDFHERQNRLLRLALNRLEARFGDYSQTAFQTEWLTWVLAGLGTPDANRYYGPERTTQDGRPIARGLFYRVLEHEFAEPAKTTARPTWFEARIGTLHNTGTPIRNDPALIETPQGSVSIHGLIDRVETVPDTSPTQAVVRDYKTGKSVPSENDILSGLKFQLPLYSLMIESAFDTIETVGASYYQVSPPTSVSSRSGLLTSQGMASYWGSDDVDTPLLRHSKPYFETHEAFRRFIEEVIPERIGELTTGITEGQFHPTILDPSDAGCHYCDYAHVCDVRSHQRQETIDAIDDAEMSAYIPPKARNLDVEDFLGAR